jgi:hypothetical protein
MRTIQLYLDFAVTCCAAYTVQLIFDVIFVESVSAACHAHPKLSGVIDI